MTASRTAGPPPPAPDHGAGTAGGVPSAGLPREYLHSALVDKLGLAVVTREFPPHAVLSIEELEVRYGVSRSVIREVIRVLSSLGLLASRRRLGTVVQPATAWNLYDPHVIRWRLASDDRIDQLRSLSELRSAIEPQAAKLAAQRASFADASELVYLSAQMWARGHDSDIAEFLKLDVLFHAKMLECSGNEMFAQLNSLVTEVLKGRIDHGLMPRSPNHEAMRFHVDVANAIQRRDGDAAQAAMTRIVEQSMDEMGVIWETGLPKPAP
ncbi:MULTISPECIES: FadR/GntR family transcriptional regulator [unclassified Arthrobacter]|uniref:FadR/GntR family transcriptional regulator n=1 Tax=unclassified Arthrobacter TaxID=235627 RepID=UPI00159E5DD3|nr:MULTISPECIES: FadR/GntR family transcriptional regulator [unclassified Arthrobacter]MCQ9162655.1 FadR family transcriptional regulator [Arthrobacter sp. STN4]NVM97362.1 FadR family transcriptional regulator [Arthrobacter sp. SDTb3-6]